MATAWRDGIYIIHRDEQNVLFESLWPASGVNYNAYILDVGGEYVLIDGFPAHLSDALLEEIRIVTEGEGVSHIVVNHMEPDHSGSLRAVLSAFPDARVYISAVGARIFTLKNAVPVSDGQKVEIGERTFTFYHVPWVHWPETMFTLVDGVLFTCDVLGSFGAFHPLSLPENYEEELLRYTVSVLGGYREHLLRALTRIEEISPSAVAPGHGAVLEGEALRRAISTVRNVFEEPSGSVVLYATMYGRTGSLAQDLAERMGSPALDVVKTNILDVLLNVQQASDVYIVFPTYEAGIFPTMESVLRLLVRKGILQGKRVYVVNVYTWAPALKKALEMLPGARGVAVKPGTPVDDVLRALSSQV